MLVPVFRSRQPLAHDNCQSHFTSNQILLQPYKPSTYFCSFLHIPTEERVQENS